MYYMFRQQWANKLWNTKDNNLRNISDFIYLFFGHAPEVIGNQNSFVTKRLQNTFFYVPQKKEGIQDWVNYDII